MPKTKAQNLRAQQIKLIKMGQAQLGLDDGTYRAMLAGLCDGKTSCTDLTGHEREKVLKHMASSGFVIKTNRRASPRNSMVKLQAMWHALAEVGAVQKPVSNEARDAAIEAWAQRMLPKSFKWLRFADEPQMQRLIEAMKKWCDRVGAPDEADQARAEQQRLAEAGLEG